MRFVREDGEMEPVRPLQGSHRRVTLLLWLRLRLRLRLRSLSPHRMPSQRQQSREADQLRGGCVTMFLEKARSESLSTCSQDEASTGTRKQDSTNSIMIMTTTEAVNLESMCMDVDGIGFVGGRLCLRLGVPSVFIRIDPVWKEKMESLLGEKGKDMSGYLVWSTSGGLHGITLASPLTMSKVTSNNH